VITIPWAPDWLQPQNGIAVDRTSSTKHTAKTVSGVATIDVDDLSKVSTRHFFKRSTRHRASVWPHSNDLHKDKNTDAC